MSSISATSSGISGSMLQSGLKGLQSNMKGLHQAATNIVQSGQASAPSSSSSMAESLVELKLYEAGAKASTHIVKAADETVGTLLDTFA